MSGRTWLHVSLDDHAGPMPHSLGWMYLCALAGDVGALAVFRHYAFEAALEAGLVQLDAILLDVVGYEDVAAGLNRLVQSRAPSRQRLPQQWLLIEIQGIEREIGDRNFVFALDAGREPLAQARVVGTPVLVCGDNLAIDDTARWNALRRRYDLGKVSREVVEAAVLQVNRAVRVARQHAAQPVPFDFEQVLGRAERSLCRCGLHRAQFARKALELDLELVGFFQASSL